MIKVLLTCLANDPRNLEIQSNRRRTPGILSQTNKQAYNKYSSNAQVKLQIEDLTRKFNLRTPVCKKNQIERSNESQTVKETSFVY